ncbi:MAG: cytochrome c3 family protein [Labilithrix sp.]
MRGLFRVLLTLALLLVARGASAQLLSPGPLSKGHAGLEGDQNCTKCHSSGKRIEPTSCLTCHNDLGARINAGQGLHGRAFRGKACESCHVEHHGVGNRLIRWPGGDQTALNHADTGWPLNGAHKNATCNKCHNKANARGAPTFLGVSPACNACHKDQHEGRFGTTCQSCHNETSWKDAKVTSQFNHDLARFKLRGAHTRVQCASCHHEPPVYLGLKFANCTDCHKDPHAGRLGPQCTGCHSENAWRPATLRPGAHPGVSLANGHSNVGCKTCHDRGVLAAPSKGTECASCHKAVHKAPFGNGCAQCHSPILWTGLPASVGLGVHNRTAYPLTGKHREVTCGDCHKTSVPRAARYRGLKFSRCMDCHGDQHKGEFAKSDFGAECKQCHATAGFRPTLFGTQLHAKAAFPLIGKHQATACSACHTNQKPRLDLHVSKKECADCHQNPHGDQFAKEMKDGGCAHCHKPSGWDMPKFEHAFWPLTGAHSGARCESCHTPTAEDRKKGSGPSWKGAPTACNGCHDDAHEGQFKKGEPVITDCARCHSTALFKIPKFDHDKLTSYPLTGEHARLSCERCHDPEKLKNGTQVIRWRLPSTECSFCHADPHKKVVLQ